MKYFAVATLKRGAIDPPERLPPWIEDAIFGAEFAAALRKPPEPEPCIELRWMREGKQLREKQA